MIWARNRTGHDQAMVLRYQPGAELGRLVLGVSRLGTTSELLWADAAALPPGRGRNPFGRDVYERRMQGRPVAETVDALRRWFHGGARQAGPLAFGLPTPPT